MSSCLESHVPAASTNEQLCYIPCKFCNIILAVSVPCGSLFDIVTVRCGHCSNLWSVNMATTTFNSLTASPIPAWPQPQQPDHFLHQAPNYSNMGDYRVDNIGYNKATLFQPNSLLIPTNNSFAEQRAVNLPPVKRQRVPSAYNQFIKEEIQRIKANNPHISHREAFSTAAKNWAHFPHIHFGLMLETSNQAKLDEGSQKHLMPRTALLNN